MDGNFRRQHFINLIEGTYTNKAQAQSDPTGHAWVWIQWIKLDENKIQSRQWYHHDGDVYRERNFIVDTEGNNVICCGDHSAVVIKLTVSVSLER